MVGRGLPGGLLAGFVERPARHRCALVREVPGGALAVGLIDGDVEAGVADGVVRAGEAAAVAQLGEDRRRSDRPDPVQTLTQRPAAGLAGGEGAQLPVERDDLQVEHVDHPQRDRDELASGRRELDMGERLPAGARARVQSGWDALVKQLRAQPQLPGAALVDERLARPHPGAQLQDVRRRDPGLRQLPR